MRLQHEAQAAGGRVEALIGNHELTLLSAHFFGQHLARMEMRIMMEELLPRLKKLELAGEPARVESVFVGGLKRLPIRFEAA